MAATRLSDAQKLELVSRFRSGASTQELADAFGCSPNTVIRVVKAALEPSLYETLKRQRVRRSTAPITAVPLSGDAQDGQGEPGVLPPEPVTEVSPDPGPQAVDAPSSEAPSADSSGDDDLPEPELAMGLAIDDADDFDGAEVEDQLEDDPGEEDPDDASPFRSSETFMEVPVVLSDLLEQPLITPRPWVASEIPASVYMLVDKTVELQARPLAEIPELGPLSPEEQDLQALVLYCNPRQAKRQCGRTQRVIKLPDTAIFERTAPYLLKQGIQRLVIEGSVYALPQS